MKELKNALPLGTELDRRYRIDSVLGSGGFGIVYQATHFHLDKLYAIKEYLPQEVAVRDGSSVHPLSSSTVGFYQDGLTRFLQEARQLIQFSQHPNIVTCSDYFEGNGTAYLVMELERGQILTEILDYRESKGQEVSQDLLLELLIPLLEGLDYIHKRDVLHRDIKPGNILIRDRDREPVLLDFGAAKEEFSRRSKSRAAHTPGYAAPEQIEESGELGPWTDIYAIGATMYRVITRKSPPRIETRMRSFMRGQADPAIITASEIGASFSQDIVSIVRQCMAMDENSRIPSAKELLERLSSLRPHSPSSDQKTILFTLDTIQEQAPTIESAGETKEPTSPSSPSSPAIVDKLDTAVETENPETPIRRSERNSDHLFDSESRESKDPEVGQESQKTESQRVKPPIHSNNNKQSSTFSHVFLLLSQNNKTIFLTGFLLILFSFLGIVAIYQGSVLSKKQLELTLLNELNLLERASASALAIRLGGYEPYLYDAVGELELHSRRIRSSGETSLSTIEGEGENPSDGAILLWNSIQTQTRILIDNKTRREQFIDDLASAVSLIAPLQQVSDDLGVAMVSEGITAQSIYHATRQIALLERLRRQLIESPFAPDDIAFENIDNHISLFKRVLNAFINGDPQLRIEANQEDSISLILREKEQAFWKLSDQIKELHKNQQAITRSNQAADELIAAIWNADSTSAKH